MYSPNPQTNNVLAATQTIDGTVWNSKLPRQFNPLRYTTDPFSNQHAHHIDGALRTMIQNATSKNPLRIFAFNHLAENHWDNAQYANGLGLCCDVAEYMHTVLGLPINDAIMSATDKVSGWLTALHTQQFPDLMQVANHHDVKNALDAHNNFMAEYTAYRTNAPQPTQPLYQQGYGSQQPAQPLYQQNTPQYQQGYGSQQPVQQQAHSVMLTPNVAAAPQQRYGTQQPYQQPAQQPNLYAPQQQQYSTGSSVGPRNSSDWGVVNNAPVAPVTQGVAFGHQPDQTKYEPVTAPKRNVEPLQSFSTEGKDSYNNWNEDKTEVVPTHTGGLYADYQPPVQAPETVPVENEMQTDQVSEWQYRFLMSLYPNGAPQGIVVIPGKDVYGYPEDSIVADNYPQHKPAYNKNIHELYYMVTKKDNKPDIKPILIPLEEPIVNYRDHEIVDPSGVALPVDPNALFNDSEEEAPKVTVAITVDDLEIVNNEDVMLAGNYREAETAMLYDMAANDILINYNTIGLEYSYSEVDLVTLSDVNPGDVNLNGTISTIRDFESADLPFEVKTLAAAKMMKFINEAIKHKLGIEDWEIEHISEFPELLGLLLTKLKLSDNLVTEFNEYIIKHIPIVTNIESQKVTKEFLSNQYGITDNTDSEDGAVEAIHTSTFLLTHNVGISRIPLASNDLGMDFLVGEAFNVMASSNETLYNLCKAAYARHTDADCIEFHIILKDGIRLQLHQSIHSTDVYSVERILK